MAIKRAALDALHETLLLVRDVGRRLHFHRPVAQVVVTIDVGRASEPIFDQRRLLHLERVSLTFPE